MPAGPLANWQMFLCFQKTTTTTTTKTKRHKRPQGPLQTEIRVVQQQNCPQGPLKTEKRFFCLNHNTTPAGPLKHGNSSLPPLKKNKDILQNTTTYYKILQQQLFGSNKGSGGWGGQQPRRQTSINIKGFKYLSVNKCKV